MNLFTKSLPGCVALFALTAAAMAQAPYQGFLFNWDRPTLGAGWGGLGRWNTSAETDLNRIDEADYKEWGRDPSGQVAVRGFAAWLFDDNYATAQTFAFVGHAEDPANPGFPLTTPAFQIPNLPMPPGTNGNVYLVTSTLPQAFGIPATGDVFVGFELPAMTVATAPYDGLWIANVSRQSSTQPGAVWDQPGPAGQQGQGVQNDDYMAFISGGVARYGTASATSLSQMALDVAVDGGMVGGVALTQTNQANLTSSNAPLGTSNFLSGLHPDINGLNLGRADEIGFGVTHHTSQMPVGSPVFILLSFGPSPFGSLPITNFGAIDPASSAGNVCIDFTAAATFVAISQPGFLANMGEAQMMLTLSPQVRSVLAAIPAPFDFWWQGVALDATATGPGLELRTTGCVVQHLK